MKKLACLSAVLLASLAIAQPAMARNWDIDGQNLILRDSDEELNLENSEAICGPSATMGSQDIRAMIAGSNSNIRWYIDQDCGEFLRVCITTNWGKGCNTYRNRGWTDFE